MSPLRKDLLMRTKLAIGSLELVQKELLVIQSVLTTGGEFVNLEPIRGKEDSMQSSMWDENQPPIEAYENDL